MKNMFKIASLLAAAVMLFACGETGNGNEGVGNGEFYLVGGFESAMAHTMSFSTFIPAVLVNKEPTGDYVKMKDSI